MDEGQGWRIAQVVAGVVALLGGIALTAFFGLYASAMALSIAPGHEPAWTGRLWALVLAGIVGGLLATLSIGLGLVGWKAAWTLPLAAAIFTLLAALSVWAGQEVGQLTFLLLLQALVTPWWSVPGGRIVKAGALLALGGLVVWSGVAALAQRDREAAERVCHPLPGRVVARLDAALADPEDAWLRGVRAVRSARDPRLWVVAGDIQAREGYGGSRNNPVWAIRTAADAPPGVLDVDDPVTAVDAYTARHSAFPEAFGDTDSKRLALTARFCVRSALEGS
jgi:hypothetical protein